MTSRRAGVEFLRWSLLALAGVGGGFALGEMAAGTRLRAGVDGPASYSHLSANPDAMVPSESTLIPCPECTDSYGVGARLRADHESRMSDEFRELGAIDVESSLPDDPADDYRYGGRFPDAAPSASDKPMQPEIAPPTVAASDQAPADTMTTSTAEQ